MTKKANNTSSNSNALHPAQTVNNIKSHVPLTLDLKKVQYETWAELFQVVARAHSVIDHLDGSPDVPTDGAWIQIDAVVLSWIYGTVSQDLLLTIIKPGSTARDAWLRVKSASLENQFNQCKLAKFPDVNSYCQRLKSLADQLSDAGNAVSDQRLVLQLVKGLTPAYQSRGKTISSRQPLPSFLDAQGILLGTVSDDNNKVSTDKNNGHRPQRTRSTRKRDRLENCSPGKETVSSTPSGNSGAAQDGVAGSSSVTTRSDSETDAQQKRKLDASPNSTITQQSDGANRGNGISSSYASLLGIPSSNSTKKFIDMLRGPDGELPAKLRSVEPYLIERISNEIMNNDPNVRWEDIAGLQFAKKCVTEMVIWPLLRPDLFKGCLSPGRGLLLFGPPGTGKTMIGKAIAGEAKATFFYISASSVLGKWMGESEKLVRALFGVASCRQPAVIFVDEIDSLLSQRSDREHDITRRIKTQFLIEMEGCDTGSEQILLIGEARATNRPQDLDEAARRRLTKRLYIPLPSSEARAWIVRNLLEKNGLFKLSTEDIDTICKSTEGSDMKNLVKDASMGPLREAFKQGTEISKLKKEDMRAVTLQDFENALQEVRPSVSPNELGSYEDWNSKFGSIPPSTMQPQKKRRKRDSESLEKLEATEVSSEVAMVQLKWWLRELHKVLPVREMIRSEVPGSPVQSQWTRLERMVLKRFYFPVCVACYLLSMATKKANTSSSSSTAPHPAQTVTNIKTHVPLTLDLEKVQYETWAELFQVVARAHSVTDHLDHHRIPPNDDKWAQIDAIVLSWIYGTVSQDLLLTIIKPGSTAHDAWLRVKTASLENQFDRCKLAEFPDVNSYCQRLRSLAGQLKAAGNAVSDQRLVLQLVKGLTPEYESQGKTISSRQPLPSFLAAQGILLAHEILCKTTSPKTPPSIVSPILTTDKVSDNNLKRMLGKRESSMQHQIPQSPSKSCKSLELTEAMLLDHVHHLLEYPFLIQQKNGKVRYLFVTTGSSFKRVFIDMLRRPNGELSAKLRSVEPYLIERISNEIMSHDPYVRWEDIAGLEYAKNCLTEMVVWPLLRPDIFKGCRSPGRGLLLFGPPGTGKTMIGKAIAGEIKATFFYISASSVLGKWMGESEKLVRALFGVASCRQPAVIFVDEIDSLLSRRSDREHDITRRIKTQFLIEMEGCDTGSEQILLIGEARATNRPQDLDEAARRRLTKRLYIPLPSSEARAWIIRNVLEKDELFKLSTEDIDSICNLTEGYSGSDMKNLVKDASMGPMREALKQGIKINELKKEDVRAVTLQDFENALQEVRPSVSLSELISYEAWNSKFGSFPPSTM
ncbi:hypothetical protein OSB04_026857 [Centaurea solstitialis]|uniref:AAA+ ATPase domain-containing protein n=1 Tax=Centaurea solstitialis TaxID=347529 RepID=A0AA38W9N8_9ASTR|nr:hypothetical protein OSB04_026857 [Centaurea solstitialis]